MDWKHKYLKYKTKYLELSTHMNNNKIIEGNENRSVNTETNTIDGIKIITELASGGNGTTYLATWKGERLIYKLEKMDVYDKSNH